MPVARVSLDGETPTAYTVELRTAALRPGVLCDIHVDEQVQLCVVESIGADGAITARRLPTPFGEPRVAKAAGAGSHS